MTRWIIPYLRRQTFQPGALAALFNPFYLVRRPRFGHLRALAPGVTGRLLDGALRGEVLEHVHEPDAALAELRRLLGLLLGGRAVTPSPSSVRCFDAVPCRASPGCHRSYC